MSFTLSLCLFSFLVALGVAQIIRLKAQDWGLVDKPNSRSSHVMPTPRGGGLGIIAAFETATLICAARGWMPVGVTVALSVGGGMIAVVGFLDDRSPLPASIRFSVHLCVAAAVAVLVCWPTWQLNPVSAFFYAIFIILLLAWGTNSFNFMDGIDGIAATQAAFMSGAAALINEHFSDDGAATLLASLAAASAGFLVLNWPPAKIFMGDGASGFLGFTLSLFAVVPFGSPHLSIAVWLILGGLFIGDSTITLLRRVFRGDAFSEAHRLHAYQHLARRWRSHLPVTAAYALVNIIWLLPWAAYVARCPNSTFWALPAALAPVVLVLLVAGAGREERKVSV